MASLCTKKLTTEISRDKSNDDRLRRLVGDIAEEVLRSSEDKDLKVAYDLDSIKHRRLTRGCMQCVGGFFSYPCLDFSRDLTFTETKFCKLCIEILDHLVLLIESRLNETGAKTHEMSGHSKRKENEDFSEVQVFERQLEARQPEQKSLSSLCTKRSTSKEIKSNDDRLSRLVTDIAEEVLLSAEENVPEDGYNWDGIRQCRNKLAKLHDRFDENLSVVKVSRLWFYPNIALFDLVEEKFQNSIVDLQAKFCKLCIEIYHHLLHLIEIRLNETGAKTHEMSDHIKKGETEGFSTGQPKVPDPYDKIATAKEGEKAERLLSYYPSLSTASSSSEASEGEKSSSSSFIQLSTASSSYEELHSPSSELEFLVSDDIIATATEMHSASYELELNNQPLLLRALPYVLEDNKKSVHLYVYSGDRNTVEELKKKAKEKFSKFNAIIECTDLAVTPLKTPPINSPGKVEELDSGTIKQINDYLQNYLCDFPSHRNVTAIMAGQKISKSSGYTNKPCITVYVLGKGRIPFGETELPSTLGNFDTDVVEGFVTELNSHRMLYHTVSRPLKLGVSVGVRGKFAAGTLGAIVKDTEGNMYALSNAHVFNPDSVDGNHQIEQPASNDHNLHIDHLEKSLNDAKLKGESVADLEYKKRKLQEVKNSKPRVIGSYKTGIKENVSFNGYKYFVDAALALIDELPDEEQATLIKEGIRLCQDKYTKETYGSERQVIEEEVEVPTANGNYKPLDDLSDDIELHKCGRTTGLTVNGEMIYERIFVQGQADPEHDKFSHREYENLWHYNCMIIKSGEKKAFSDKGDSGSLVLDGKGNAWALIFGDFQSSFGTWTSLACPIEVVLKELGSRIDSELTIIGKVPL